MCSFGSRYVSVTADTVSKVAVSGWHYKAFGLSEAVVGVPDGESWEILQRTLSPSTTLVTGAALHNLGALLRQVPSTHPPASLGRIFLQGGFAGANVVPEDRVLTKFKGMTVCPTFNLNGDIPSAKLLLERRTLFSEVRFVSKNVCHGVLYDDAIHARLQEACLGPATPMRVVHEMMTRSMRHYLPQGGKAMHDPLAACCAIDPSVGLWSEVEMSHTKGGWGCALAPGSGVLILVDYSWDRFVSVLLGGKADTFQPAVGVPRAFEDKTGEKEEKKKARRLANMQ